MSKRIKVIDSQLVVQRDYWLERLSPDFEPSNLRLDFERPADYEYEPQEVIVNLPDALFEKLTGVTGLSPFLIYTAMMTALKVCLQRYTGSPRVVVGSPARRKENATGETVNALAILSDISSQMSFRQCLAEERKVLSEAYKHQDYPVERLLKDLGLAGIENKRRLFDVALCMLNLHSELAAVKNDLTIYCACSENALQVKALYNGLLFLSDTVQRFVNHFITVLDSGLRRSDAQVGDLDMLSPAERYQALIEWNRNEKAYPSDRCIHELFESQQQRTPDSIALACGDSQLTYVELERRSNQLAHYLLAHGAGVESLVGVAVERSPEMLIAVLGTLKAGAAFVPIDPAYPAERVEFMLNDSALSILLTQKRLVETLPGMYASVVCLDADWHSIAGESDERADSGVAADNAAYVIYTSGSTGWPKGALLSHRGVSNLAAAQVEVFGVSPDSRVFQFASLSFDASVSEIFMALTTGATLCLAVGESPVGPVLSEILREQAVTTVTLPPAILATMRDDDLPAVETLIAAGESCPADISSRWSAGRRFINAYGPTETTVCASLFEFPGVFPQAPPIGRPMANMQIYLLENGRHPAPVGVSGELFVAGVGLARGYLNRPDLTAERFIPNGLDGKPGARLYKTGDLARYHVDGNIDFIGRIDHQVKIRGLRIELEEIAAVLREHPAVREAVVVVREQGAGDRRLVAYWTTDQPTRPTANELRTFLGKRLPDYMAPSHLVVLDALPLSENGKLDRRALPEPMPDDSRRGAIDLPRSPVEEILAGMWEDVLEIDRVAAEDHFFELGGNSLLGTQVVSRVRKAFQVEMPIRALFEAPILADQARIIENLMCAEGRRLSPPIGRASKTGAIPLSFAQERLWFLDQLEPGNVAYNPAVSVRLQGPLDVAALELSFQEVVRRHEALRTTFAVIDGQPVQVISPGVAYAYQFEDLSGVSPPEREAKARQIITLEAERPFDLAQGPLFRIALVRMEEDEHVMLLAMHHIVADGWSMGILIREVTLLYSAFRRNQPSTLAELPIQYADFSVWQREWIQGQVLDEQISYWRKRLIGLRQLRLPSDRPRPKSQTFCGARESVALTKSLSEEVKSLSRRAGVTLFMTLLAAFKCLLFRHTGQEDIVVATGIANRNRGETEGLIGFFVNMLVLRTDLSGNPSFQELLERERQVAMGAYAHQDMPFAKLVEFLRPDRRLSATPLFQVVFVLQNIAMPALALEGMTLHPMELESRTTHFDLTMEWFDTEQGLRGALEYSTDLFDAPTIRRLLRQYETLLTAIVENQEARLLDIELDEQANGGALTSYQRQLENDLFSFGSLS